MMLKVTDEIREAARRLLARHNASEADRAEARYNDALEKAESRVAYHGGAANKEYIRKRASIELPKDKDQRHRLEAVVNGKRKQIDANWWREVHGDVDRAKLDKIAALADPGRNDNEHERAAAARKLAAAKARRPPGMRPLPPPLPTDLSGLVRKRKTKQSPSPQPTRRMSDRVAVSDSVASAVKHTTDSGAPTVKQMSNSVASAHLSDKLEVLNERRAEIRAAERSNLKCQSCGKPLAAQRVSARYCSVTCRSRAWRKQH